MRALSGASLAVIGTAAALCFGTPSAAADEKRNEGAAAVAPAAEHAGSTGGLKRDPVGDAAGDPPAATADDLADDLPAPVADEETEAGTAADGDTGEEGDERVDEVTGGIAGGGITGPAGEAEDGAAGRIDGSDLTSFDFTVSPLTVAPGGTVTLNAAECASPTVTASSGVFETVTLSGGRPGTARIFEHAEADTEYDVTFDCKGEKGTAKLSVKGSRPPGEAGNHTTPQHPVKPGGGVNAGAGGDSGGPSAAQITAGSLLVAGAVGGGGLLLRRRAEGGG
ncbi:hypothetical protein [Streptomyces sp. CAU 1734]|uniref:hypothetical protein n=1 Tax=Streptomyces sp. CAU 1734 TaxID=3140360 RepID=UPI0032615F87